MGSIRIVLLMMMLMPGEQQERDALLGCELRCFMASDPQSYASVSN